MLTVSRSASGAVMLTVVSGSASGAVMLTVVTGSASGAVMLTVVAGSASGAVMLTIVTGSSSGAVMLTVVTATASGAVMLTVVTGSASGAVMLTVVTGSARGAPRHRRALQPSAGAAEIGNGCAQGREKRPRHRPQGDTAPHAGSQVRAALPLSSGRHSTSRWLTSKSRLATVLRATQHLTLANK